MLLKLERYAIHVGTQYLRRYFSKNVNISTNKPQEFALQINKNVLHREGQKSLKVAILGAPNVGKSTIINQLAKRSICPTSSKVHTTRTKARAIYCDNDIQLIFMDTPGMVSKQECKKYKLAKTFKNDPETCLKTSDIVGIVQDVSNLYTRDKIDQNIMELLSINKNIQNTIPLILIFNKVDRLKKKEVLLHLSNVLANSKDSLNFSDIFMISALNGDGINDLRTYLLDLAKPQDWHYEEHVYSDHTCEDIIQQTIRAKLMDNLPNEIPYKCHVKLDHFDATPDDSIKAQVSVICPNQRIKNLLLTFKGKRVKDIANMAEEELRNAFRTSVRLRINIEAK